MKTSPALSCLTSSVRVFILVVAIAAAGHSAFAQSSASGGRVPRISPVRPPIGQISLISNKSTISRSVGQKAKLVLVRNGGDNTADLTVSLAISGTAVNGEDYLPVSTSAVIPTGEDLVKVRIIPFATGNGGKVKVVVLPGDGYSVSGTSKVKLKIVD